MVMEKNVSIILLSTIIVVLLVLILYIYLQSSSSTSNFKLSSVPIAPSSTNTNITTLNPSVSSVNGSQCNGFVLSTSKLDSIVKGTCTFGGGFLNVRLGAGNSGSMLVELTNINTNTTPIFIQKFNKDCNSSIGAYNLSAGTYTVEILTGVGPGSCGNAYISLKQV
ncbi:MAG: hypothetical protein ACP5SJ_03180 [Candidatus Micrarchaeia archaeon]